MSKDALRSLGTAVTAPIRHSPNGIYKDRLRAFLWREFGAPRDGFPLYLPRRALLIDAGDTVLEIGAMNPSSVHTFADLATRHGEVFLFEPTRGAQECLSPAVAEYPHVTLDGRGIWPEAGQKTMSSDPRYDGGGRVRDPEIESELPPLNDPDDVSVEMVPLDIAVREHDIQPDFIEVLTNGTEYDVLSSGREVLREYRPRILTKTYGLSPSNRPKRVERLVSLLESEGYRLEYAPFSSADPSNDALDGDIYAWHPARDYS